MKYTILILLLISSISLHGMQKLSTDEKAELKQLITQVRCAIKSPSYLKGKVVKGNFIVNGFEQIRKFLDVHAIEYPKTVTFVSKDMYLRHESLAWLNQLNKRLTETKDIDV